MKNKKIVCILIIMFSAVCSTFSFGEEEDYPRVYRIDSRIDTVFDIEE